MCWIFVLTYNFKKGGDGNDVELRVESVLPVELISFTGRAVAKTNVLSFTTATESGFSHFEVESLASSEWVYLGAAAGAMEGTREPVDYSFIDEQPLPSAYYRLKMVDLDGSFVYSDLVQVERNLFSPASEMLVYPNPGNGPFAVSVPTEETVSLTLYDQLGREVWRRTTTEDLSVHKPGIYLLVATNKTGQRWVERLVVRSARH